ncbi:MAG: hypothetical protein ACRDOL_37200 [Streptosporangiaceae bacterium]
MRRAALPLAAARAAGLLAACGGGAAPANLISVSNGGCGGTWQPTAPGWHTFQIYNAAAESGEVDLVDPANGAIYAEVNGLGPGTSSPMRLDVGSGSYAFRCLFDDYDPMTGPAAVIGGHVRGTPAILSIWLAALTEREQRQARRIARAERRDGRVVAEGEAEQREE